MEWQLHIGSHTRFAKTIVREQFKDAMVNLFLKFGTLLPKTFLLLVARCVGLSIHTVRLNALALEDVTHVVKALLGRKRVKAFGCNIGRVEKDVLVPAAKSYLTILDFPIQIFPVAIKHITMMIALLHEV